MVTVKHVSEAERLRVKATPSELRHLPSELVATDAQDGDKVYKHDAPHIMKGLIRQMAKEKAAGYKTPPCVIVKGVARLRFMAMLHDCDNKLPLTQKVVDVIRAKQLSELACKLLSKRDITAQDFKYRHLWFPKPTEFGASEVKLQEGPGHFRTPNEALPYSSLALTLDVCDWPEAVRDGLSSVRAYVDATEAKLRDVYHRLKLGLAPESPLVLPPSFKS